ncbi:MAG TPA: hypothetical protein DCL41_01435 [Bdellovibrionales bacterium]|nr:hypothetical protein [Bdellovibrionales bacterium]
MEKNSEFIERHLDKVSRSFAFCIRQLPEPLHLWVGISYLLCRIVDTVEDSEFSDLNHQLEAFDWFDRSITEHKSNLEMYQYPQNLLPAGISEGEADLLRESARVFEVFWSMDETARDRVSKLAHSMSLGMRHFRTRSQEGLRLKNLKEVNQYCFFVAGVVGEMLVGFVSQVEPRFPRSVSQVLKAHHFGLFLQKVNLLKDQLKDQKLGRFLVPSRGEVESSARENAGQAFLFLTDLPLEQMEFRRFCAWSLFMGIESLKAASTGFRKGLSQKMSRPQTEALLMEVEERLGDNSRLKELFESSSKGLGWVEAPDFKSLSAVREAESSEKAPGWFFQLYQGALPAQDFSALGIV